MNERRRVRTLSRSHAALIIGLLLASVLASAVVGSVGSAAPRSGSEPAGPAILGHVESSGMPHGTSPGPDAALTLSVAGVTPAAISLSWTNPGTTFFQSYTVQESANGSAGPWTSVGQTTTQTSLALAVDGLSPGGTYWWMVVESYGLITTNTEDSNVVAQSQPSVAFLNASGVTSTSATLSWTNNASYGGLVGFVSYTVYEAVGNGTAGPTTTYTSVSTLSDTVTDLTPGTGYTFYLVTDDCTAGCGTGTPTVSATQSNSVPVGAALPLAVSISARQNTVDVGELAYFTCTATGGVTPYSFSWDYGNGTFVPGNASVSQPFGSTGTPQVTCKVTDGSSSSAEDATTLTVNPAPVLTATSNRTAADVAQPVDFSCTVTGGTTPVSLGWVFGDGTSFVGASTSHPYSTAGQFVAVCSGTDGAGVPVVGSVSVTISPTLVVQVQTSSAAAAPGSTVTLTADAGNGSGNYTSYAWSFGDGSTGSGASVQHSFALSGTFHPTVTVLDSNGAGAIAATTVAVSPISIQAGAIPTSIVRGTSLAFTASATGGAGGPYNYTWTFGDGTTAYGAAVSHVFTTTGSFTANLTVRDNLGAQSTESVGTIAVTAPPPAAPAFAGDFVWIVLLIALLIALIVAALGYRYHRSAEESSHRRVAGWVPPTGPSRTVAGMKICTFCQAHNLPIRRTCSACGKPLPRAPSP